MGKQQVNVALIGIGHLGRFHASKVQASELARLACVVDIDEDARGWASAELGVPTHAALDEVDAAIDACIIASPTSSHAELAAAAMHRGWHVLVEKPMCATVDEARRLVALAREKERVLQVGHTERFNPAVDAALEVVDVPGYIVAERLGPFSGRSTDVDVIRDLMIHDLDIVGALIDAPLREARAVGVPVLTGDIDMAAARLEFDNGTVAQISAGRASLEPSRRIRLFTATRYVSIDCAAKEVKSVRRIPAADGAGAPQLTGEPIEVQDRDALAAQDDDFFRCVRDGARPRVDGAAGLRALELAKAVRDALTMPIPTGVELDVYH